MAYVKGPAVQSFQSVPENQADIVQGIGELMGDPAGQLADSGQFLQIAPVVLVSLGDREPVPVTLQGDVGIFFRLRACPGIHVHPAQTQKISAFVLKNLPPSGKQWTLPSGHTTRHFASPVSRACPIFPS
jgi:hypothetical protein